MMTIFGEFIGWNRNSVAKRKFPSITKTDMAVTHQLYTNICILYVRVGNGGEICTKSIRRNVGILQDCTAVQPG